MNEVMKTRRRAWGAAIRGAAGALVFALAAACGGEENNGVEPGGPRSKCPKGTECFAGNQCVAGECSTGADGETCDNRIISCDPGLTCVDSRCRPQ